VSTFCLPRFIAKIEQITNDPASVQQEVEQTLHRLRERYRELKLQLEQTHQRNLQKGFASPALDITKFKVSVPGKATAAAAVMQSEEEKKWSFSAHSFNQLRSDSVGEKRPNGKPRVGLKRSLSSFGKEELIALEVLGGRLPQSASISEFQEDRRAEALVSEMPEPASAYEFQEDSGRKMGKGGGENESMIDSAHNCANCTH
jgi:hypothetical protein